ncbi:hypothetical protein ZWY2020_010553 [Hordeum vulgare]|nr:hypothetical protein ZWY2020_010553 [Hordeum vulgare]
MNDTMMNSTQDPAGRRSSTIQRQLVRDASGTQDQSDTAVSANDMCALEEWPSHTRHDRAQLQDEDGG